MRSSPFCTQALYTMHKDMKMNRDEQKQQHIVIQLKTIHLLFKCRQKAELPYCKLQLTKQS